MAHLIEMLFNVVDQMGGSSESTEQCIRRDFRSSTAGVNFEEKYCGTINVYGECGISFETNRAAI